MARIPYPEPDNLEKEVRAQLEGLAPLNIFLMLAHGGGLLRSFVDLGTYLLFKTRLDPVLREIAIIRVGVLSASKYEVFQHERIGRQLGMKSDLLNAIHDGPESPCLTPLQGLVIRYTDEVVRNVRASDGLFHLLKDQLSIRPLQELTVTIGYYMMVCRFLENFEVDLEEDGQTEGLKVRR